MSKSSNQKLKLSYLTKIMLAKTDEEHSLTMPQILQELFVLQFVFFLFAHIVLLVLITNAE